MSDLKFSSRHLDPDVLEILKNLDVVSYEGLHYIEGVPQLPDHIYQKLKVTFHALDIHWNGEAFVSPHNPAFKIEEVLEKGRSLKVNPFSLHESTEAMISDLFLIAGFPEPSDYPYLICEPSAGTGAIAKALRKRYPNATIHCYEIDPINKNALELLGFEVVGNDFLKGVPKEKYDLVAMNPPFNRDEWVRHLKKAQTIVKPHGIVGAIIPDSIRQESKSKEINSLKTMIGKVGYVEENTHDFATTKTKTVILKLPFFGKADQERYDQPIEGYPSTGAYQVARVLFSDSTFYESMEYAKNYSQMRTLVERTLNRITRESLVFFPMAEPYLSQIIRESLNKSEMIRLAKQKSRNKSRENKENKKVTSVL